MENDSFGRKIKGSKCVSVSIYTYLTTVRSSSLWHISWYMPLSVVNPAHPIDLAGLLALPRLIEQQMVEGPVPLWAEHLANIAIHGGFLSHRGTPSYHPVSMGFSMK